MVLVVGRRAAVVSEVHTEIDVEIEAVQQSVLIDCSQFHERSGGHGVALVVSLVVVQLGLGVESLRGDTVGVAVVLLGAIFILPVPGRVKHIVSVHILQVNRIDRSHKLGCVPDVRGRASGGVLEIGHRVREVGAHSHLEPVRGLHVPADPAGETVEVSVLKSTVLLVVTQGIQIGCLLGSAADRKHVLGTESLVVADLVHPVLVPGRHSVLLDLPGLLVDQLRPRVILVRVVIFRILQSTDRLTKVVGGIDARGLEIHSGAVLGGVAQGLVGQFDIVAHSDKVIAFQSSGGHAEVTLVAYVHPVLASFLGGDHDDTVRSTGSVKGTCRSVLQHCHRLDVRRVDGADGSVVRHTVHNIQRAGRSVHRSGSTHHNRRSLARLAASGSHLDSGHGSLERFREVTDRPLAELIALHHAGGTGE